jgi:hypothetical protein
VEASELDQTEEAVERSLEPARTRKAAKAKKARKVESRHIDPERLYTAIQYMKEHPER